MLWEVQKFRSSEVQSILRSPEVQKFGSPVITITSNSNVQETIDWTSGLLDFYIIVILRKPSRRLLLVVEALEALDVFHAVLHLRLLAQVEVVVVGGEITRHTTQTADIV